MTIFRPISPPTVSQVAALAALDATEELDGHVRVYATNRDRLLSALREAGFGSIAPADGAFYLYANVTPFGVDATTFTAKLLEETGVAATPGTDFDPQQGNRWVRFSYAGSVGEVDRAAGALPFLVVATAGTTSTGATGSSENTKLPPKTVNR